MGETAAPPSIEMFKRVDGFTSFNPSYATYQEYFDIFSKKCNAGPFPDTSRGQAWSANGGG